MEAGSQRTIRFGDYEADLRSGELRRQAQKVRIQEKPFQVLAALLARAGEVVTREELRQSLWPADTFVDFEHGLNTAVNKVRDALRDSASNPRYIETIPRRGYRFIGEVSSEQPRTQGVPLEEESASPSQDDSELPRIEPRMARALLVVIELSYLLSYIEALHHLQLERALAHYGFGEALARSIAVATIIWCAVGLPMRFYLLFAVSFDYHLLGEKFRRIFPPLLLLDAGWSAMAFFLIGEIGLGLAFALFVLAIYSPFAQRTLVLAAYDADSRKWSRATAP